MSLSPPLPAEIKVFRQLTGMSQASLADHLGVSRRAVEEWEAGRRAPQGYLRLALAQVFSPKAEPWFPTLQISQDGEGWSVRVAPPDDARFAGEAIARVDSEGAAIEFIRVHTGSRETVRVVRYNSI